MPYTKSPDGTYPTTAIDLPYDGEDVNHDTLMRSATAAKGPIGKLIDRVGWLKGRRAIYGGCTSNASGGIASQFSSKAEDGATADLVATISGNHVRVTFAAAMPSVNYAVIPGSSIGPYFAVAPQANKTTTYFEIFFFDAAGAAVDASANLVGLDFTVFAPN